ncbi:Subtilase-type proteinase RRT12 [Spathaspora sp. JA1]|nr:Subtilase-type proteinase RRT12 [Spathaspora sp. JA1]
MRDSNYKAISSNKAAVTITTSLYDRRALDVTSDKPLVNSLNYLTYLVSSSAKVRETLSIDGGIERLIEILHECHNNNFQDTGCNNEKKLLTAWKWTLAFQCLVLAGTRGTEKIRQKVVEAGILPIIATVLDNYLSLNERTFLHANSRQLLPQQQQLHQQSAPLPQGSNHSDLQEQDPDLHVPFTNPFPPQMNSQPRQNIREQFAVFNTQVDTSMMPTTAATAAATAAAAATAPPQLAMDDTITQSATASFTNYNSNDDAYPIQVATEAIERTSISNNSPACSASYFNHINNLTFDDYENLTIEQLFKLIRIANLSGTGPQYNNGDHPPPHYKNNTINNDIRRRYIIVNIINKLKEEKQLEMLDDKFFNDCEYEMDIRNFTETGVVIPRDDDIVWSLQLLAYISKYPYLKDVLQNTHLVLDMSIREKHARSNLERQMKLKMKKTLAVKLRSSTSPKLKLSCLTFNPSPSNSPQMVNAIHDDSLMLEEDTLKLVNNETGLTENAEIEDEAESVEAEDDEDEDSDILSSGSVNTEELLLDDYSKRTVENSDYLVKLYDSIIDCESIVDDLEREISLFQINEKMNKFIELESKKLTTFDVRIQHEAPRHLARISRARRMRPGKQYPYLFDSRNSGQNVNAYVIDSGVRVDHPEFSGRAQSGKDFTNEGPGDHNGHGTHVAGIIGSRTYGVAKNVNLIEIKALNSKGAGSLSSILAAIEFAAKHRQQSGKLGVANLSLGAFKNSCLNRAIEKAINTGLIIVVAAGNTNADACLTSPASSPHAITVGAINDYDDSLTGFTNWGPCVDIFASGSQVRSVNAHDFESSQILSGTSMAAPIVSGLVANLLSEGIEPLKVKETLISRATKDRIPRASINITKHTPNRIANNGIIEEIESEHDNENIDIVKDQSINSLHK